MIAERTVPLLDGRREPRGRVRSLGRRPSSSATAACLVMLALCGASFAQIRVPTDKPAASEIAKEQLVTPPEGVRRALLICGLTGDAEHRKLFAETVEKLHAGLSMNHGFAPDNIAVYWSDEPTEKDGPALRSNRAIPTREALAEAVAAVEQTIRPSDTLWVFVMGHAHYDGRYSWLNLPGPDLNQIDFGKLFAGVRSREQAFFITSPASGFFLKPLAAPGRFVVTATEAELELNETLFAHHLAKGLAEPPAFAEMDLDSDGRLSFLDLYLWTARETAQEYVTADLLATEHSLLDDNGDGKGVEVQANFLPEDLGGRLRASSSKPILRSGDGALSRRMFLAHPPSPPAPDAALDE